MATAYYPLHSQNINHSSPPIINLGIQVLAALPICLYFKAKLHRFRLIMIKEVVGRIITLTNPSISRKNHSGNKRKIMISISKYKNYWIGMRILLVSNNNLWLGMVKNIRGVLKVLAIMPTKVLMKDPVIGLKSLRKTNWFSNKLLMILAMVQFFKKEWRTVEYLWRVWLAKWPSYRKSNKKSGRKRWVKFLKFYCRNSNML